MRTLLLSLTALFTASITSSAVYAEGPNYPELAGYQKIIIKYDESRSQNFVQFKVTAKYTGDCNNRIIAKAEERTLEGWGYTYYVLSTEMSPMATRIFCGMPKPQKYTGVVKKMIRINHDTVVYVRNNESMGYRYFQPTSWTNVSPKVDGKNKLACVKFQERCRAAFCTGGYKLVNLATNKTIKYFRHWDYRKGALAACRNELSNY